MPSQIHALNYGFFRIKSLIRQYSVVSTRKPWTNRVFFFLSQRQIDVRYLKGSRCWLIAEDPKALIERSAYKSRLILVPCSSIFKHHSRWHICLPLPPPTPPHYTLLITFYESNNIRRAIQSPDIVNFVA